MKQNKIYVGNLPYTTSSDELNEFFGSCGQIEDVQIITDRETGRSKGFAFVTFAQDSSVEAAIKLNGSSLGNRQIRVSLAKEGGGRSSKGGGSGGFSRNRRHQSSDERQW